MQGNIEAIRRAFSKGEITANKTGISIIYRREFETIQSLNTNDGDYCWVFKELVDCSKSVRLKLKDGKQAVIEFEIPGISNNDSKYDPAITDRISYEEFAETIGNGNSSDIASFLVGVDLNDEDAVLDKVADFIKKERELHKSNIVKFFERKTLRNLINIANEFEAENVETYITNPYCEEFDGSVEITFDGTDGNIKIVGKLKSCLSELIDSSGDVGIEVGKESNSITFVFYV